MKHNLLTSLVLIGSFSGLSTQQGLEEPLPTNGLQVVFEVRGDSTPRWSESLDNFLPKIHAYGFGEAITKAGTSSRIKTVQCGPNKKTINPNGIFHYRYFITSLQGTHHRTETEHEKKWKNVLSLRTNGTLLSWVEGEAVDGKIAAFERQEMSREMISAASGLCDQYANLPCVHGRPNKGDCLCAPWV
ncbi:hypothetical protein B0T14DRAFT_493483 [Immersiella caudata]|uniref:Uncharacterized protein n=1 Tax=Immersiella caudata TaxID=314043 RepID=A0AA39X4Y6_9PEZI|nr:hypothetical protein B0T14DRAFT_493483 [Immersiella caudata]